MSDLEFSAIEDHNQEQSDYPSFFFNQVPIIIKQESSSKQQSQSKQQDHDDISFTLQLDLQIKKSENTPTKIKKTQKSCYLDQQVDLAVSVFELILQEIQRQKKKTAFEQIKLTYIDSMSKTKAILAQAEMQSHLLTCNDEQVDDVFQFQSFGMKNNQVLAPKYTNRNQYSNQSKKQTVKLKSYRKYQTTDDETIPKQETQTKYKKYKDKENKQRKKSIMYNAVKQVQIKTMRKSKLSQSKKNQNKLYIFSHPYQSQTSKLFSIQLNDCSQCQYCQKIAAIKKKTQRLCL